MRRKAKPEPKPAKAPKLTIPERKKAGTWFWTHLKGSTKMLCQGPKEKCEAWLKSRFMFEQYELGFILIDTWFKNRSKDEAETPETPEPDDGLPELPADHLLDP